MLNAMIFYIFFGIQINIENPNFHKNPNFQGIIEYFTFQNILSNQTLIKGVYLFPAGNIGVISKDKNKLNLKQYWDFNFQPTQDNIDYEEYLIECEKLLTQSVSRQLVSDVDLGCYLSGGIDSSSIVVNASKKYHI